MSSSKVSLRTEKTRSGGIELGELASTARSTKVQTGEVDQEIMVNMWED